MISVSKTHQQRALVAFCGLAGLRIGEALDMAVPAIYIDEMVLEVRGKGDRSRIIPMSEGTWDNICPAYIDAISVNPSSKLIHYQDRSARLAITNMGVRAGLSRKISSHDLRATFATAVYDHTKDLRVAQELLGHANSSTTEIYTGVSLEAMREGMNFDA